MDTKSLIGQRFGRLLVLEFAGHKSRSMWTCKCDCGTIKAIDRSHLKRSLTRSCGCLGREMAGVSGKARMLKHGHALSRDHAPSPEYKTWISIVERCEKESYPRWRDYGGRGIRVCAEWRQSFETFMQDVGPRPSPRHSIDRMDNSGNYEPGNVRWATRIEQGRNKRNNRILEIDGVSRCISEWAELSGIQYGTIMARLRRYGWDVKRAVFEKAKPALPPCTHRDGGHTPENTYSYVNADGRRKQHCRECFRMATRRYQQRKRLGTGVEPSVTVIEGGV